MATAFVSHATEDKYFVNLLVDILKYHHVDCWYDSEAILVGKKYKEEISTGLKKAENLVVVISENTSRSDWVKREINQFQVLKPKSTIVPLLLNPIPPDTIYDGLKEYQSIFFYENMSNGFRNLLKFFGKEFLPPFERRKASERRDDERRTTDRRKHNVQQRLRYGLWEDYERTAASGQGKFDLFEASILSLGQFTRALTPNPHDKEINAELSRYDFVDKSTGKVIKITSDLVEQNLYAVIDDLRKEFSYIKYVYITDMLAERLAKTYDVIPHDKRQRDRRARKDRRV